MKESVKKVTTLKDIAQRLGVSENTVSRALRNCSDIGAETEERVRRAAREMNYHPNYIAAYMATGKSNTIAVIISSLLNPFFAVCLEYIFNFLTEKGYNSQVIVKRGGKLQINDILRCVQSGACGILTFLDLEKATVDYCEENRIPILLCANQSQDDRVSTVYYDEYRCGKLVAQKALSVGVRRPCYINMLGDGDEASSVNVGRRRGFVHTLETGGVACDEYVYDYASSDIQKEAERLHALVKNNDFVFCFNDEIAALIKKVCSDLPALHGRIYGVDGITRYLNYSFPINSVGSDLKMLSQRCCQLIIRRIEQNDQKIIRELFPVELVCVEE